MGQKVTFLMCFLKKSCQLAKKGVPAGVPVCTTLAPGMILVLLLLVSDIDFSSYMLSSNSSMYDIPKDIPREAIENPSKTFYFPIISDTKTNPLYDRSFPRIPADKEKAEAVKEAFMHAWTPYRKYCWGQDEFVPHSRSCSNTLHAGLTIVDSLSTLYIMNLTEEFKAARDYIANDFKPSGSWSLFEFLIRFVGGFVSTYQLTGDEIFLKRAVECADAVYPLMEGGIFGGGIALSYFGGKLTARRTSNGGTSLVDTSTYQLEFIALSMVTGDPKYINLAMKTYNIIWRNTAGHGLISGPYSSGGQLHVGGGTDSYFEYIIKIYVMTRGYAKIFLNKYLEIARDIKEKLIIHSGKSNYTGLGISYGGGRASPRQEHLATFAGGMLAVGTVKDNPGAAEDLKLADELATGYYYSYASTQTGVGPEFMDFVQSKDRDFRASDPTYKLRPESVESECVMFRFTGLPKFRDYSWKMFQAINTYARKENGFAWIHNVESKDKYSSTAQDSYFLAETLKYLYLTFSNTSLISPAEWVFNTEGHPLKIFTDEEAKKWAPFLTGSSIKSILNSYINH